MVLPEKIEKLDTKNVADSLQKIEKYLSYMCERIEHTATNNRRRVTELEKEIKTLKQQLGIK